jgi:hypothetical protein
MSQSLTDFLFVTWKFVYKFLCISVSLCVCLSVCPSPNLCSRYLKCQCRWKSSFWQIVSVDRVAVRKEIFRSKVKGQGHNWPSKFKFWQSITLSFLKIETCGLHQNVSNQFLYYKKIYSYLVI